MGSKKDTEYTIRSISIAVGATCLLAFPAQTVFATSTIASRVEAFCAPTPTMPDVTSCSACHSTTNNRGLSDLTTAGVWALNRQDSNFCPSATPPPTGTPAPAPAPAPTPGTGRGMGTGSGGSSMGMGIGGSSSDEDDDDDDNKPEDD